MLQESTTDKLAVVKRHQLQLHMPRRRSACRGRGGRWGAPLRQDYSAYSDLVFVRLQLLFEALLGDLLLLLFGCRLGPAGKRHCLRNAMITTARAWRGLLRTVLEGFTSFVQPTAQHLDLHAAENCGQQPGPTDRLDIITESNVHALTS